MPSWSVNELRAHRTIRRAEAQAMARALSSPLRLRALRLCAFESRTNKELAELLGMNPGTMLHHVRTLVQTGFLEAEPERAGARGAREVPYRATGLSWRTSMPEGRRVLVEMFLQQIEGLAPEELRHHLARAASSTTSTGRSSSGGSTSCWTSSRSAVRMPTARRSASSPPSTPTSTRRLPRVSLGLR